MFQRYIALLRDSEEAGATFPPFEGEVPACLWPRCYLCAVGSGPFAASALSSVDSTTGARLETVSPGRGRMTITPCVERPERLMSSTGIRITVPPLEISITW